MSKSNLALTSFACEVYKSLPSWPIKFPKGVPYDANPMIQLGPFHHHLTMRSAFYTVYSLKAMQVHNRECFHTLVSILGTDDTIHHLQSSPSWDLQCMAQMGTYQSLLFVPLVRWICHFYVSFSLSSYCITSVGLWTTWSQVTRIHIVYTYVNKVACDSCWRVCPSTGTPQNFSAMNLGVRTVV